MCPVLLFQALLLPVQRLDGRRRDPTHIDNGNVLIIRTVETECGVEVLRHRPQMTHPSAVGVVRPVLSSAGQ